MKQQRNDKTRAAGLLLAAAALPLTPLAAQTGGTLPITVDPASSPAAAATGAADQAVTMEPIVNTEPSGNEPDLAEPAAASARPAAREESRPRSARAAPSPAPPPAAAPAEAPATVPEAPVTVPIAAMPSPVPPAQPRPEPQAAPSPTTVVNEVQRRGTTFYPWLIGMVVLVGALALIFLRTRRRSDAQLAHSDLQLVMPTGSAPSPFAPSPAIAAIVAPPDFEDQDMTEPSTAEPVQEAAPVAATPDRAVRNGRPALQLLMRPVRAGVTEADARVDFELIVDNRGSAPVRDVRVAIWLVPAGSVNGARREIVPTETAAAARLEEVDPGRAELIESSVALATTEIDSDAVLPIVVAEARYRLRDGREECASAKFAVGVPLENELARFDLEHPSGMHENVVARPVEELEHA